MQHTLLSAATRAICGRKELASLGGRAKSKIPNFIYLHFLVMNLQDVFKKIELALTPEKVELASMSLADGTMVEAEVFEAGANVFLVGGDGEKIAAPVGEHSLEDGRILVIEEEGVIKEIKEAPVEEVTIEVEAAEEEAPEVTIADLLGLVEGLREEVEMMKQKMAEMPVVEEEKEEVGVAMAAQRPIVAAPVEKKHELKFHIGADRVSNTKDRVFSKLFNN
jgi:hypothetical protein